MSSQTEIEVLAGPSREQLFDALRLRNEMRKVCFTVTHAGSDKEEMWTTIDGLRFWGEEYDDARWEVLMHEHGIEVRGWYDTQQRKGVFHQRHP